MADDRTYIKLHDGMPDHPKVVGLSHVGFRLLVELWCYSSRYLTDGRVPDLLARKRGDDAFEELEAAGLIVAHDRGWQMRDYLEHQRSAAEVAELKWKRAEAGSKGGKARANRLASATANGQANPKQTGSKSVAETETETETEEERTSVPSDAIEIARQDVERVCAHMAARVADNGSRRPTVTAKWRDSARLLLDKDGHTEQQVINAIDWCQDHEFWRGVVMSMPKLREKYDQMRLQAHGRAASKQATTDGLFDRAMERAKAREQG